MRSETIAKLDKANKERFPDKFDYYRFLMEQLQSHLVEVDELKRKGDSHYIKEIADISILVGLLALSEGADDAIFEERYKRFEEKTRRNIKPKTI